MGQGTSSLAGAQPTQAAPTTAVSAAVETPPPPAAVAASAQPTGIVGDGRSTMSSMRECASNVGTSIWNKASAFLSNSLIALKSFVNIFIKLLGFQGLQTCESACCNQVATVPASEAATSTVESEVGSNAGSSSSAVTA